MFTCNIRNWFTDLYDVPNVVIFYRNAKRELNDIRFEFAVGKDSAEGIASELVGAGLVDGQDIVAISANLQKLIDSQGAIKIVTFPLVSIVTLVIKHTNIGIKRMLSIAHFTYVFIEK